MPNEQPTDISFYVVPHADDWQLFMQPNAYNDLVASRSKVVFIITTAGDAGAGKAYWSAREEGLKSSIRFCLAPLATMEQSTGTRQFNSHTINYWSINNAICYFLRLPDGDLHGNGFSAQGYHSLLKLRAGQISYIEAVDASCRYHSWRDVYTTIQAIMEWESDGISNRCVNYLNPDTTENPNDHADHVATGQAIQDMDVIPGLRQALFVGYSVRNEGANLDGTDLFWKVGMFAAYEKAVLDGSDYSTLHEGIDIYMDWCLKKPKFITPGT